MDAVSGTILNHITEEQIENAVFLWNWLILFFYELRKTADFELFTVLFLNSANLIDNSAIKDRAKAKSITQM